MVICRINKTNALSGRKEQFHYGSKRELCRQDQPEADEKAAGRTIYEEDGVTEMTMGPQAQ